MNAVDVDGLMEQAVRLQERGDPVQAERALRQLLQWAPERWEAMLMLGDAMCIQGRFRDALQHWQDMLEKTPTARPLYERIALAFDGLDRSSEADEVRRMAAALPAESGGNAATLVYGSPEYESLAHQLRARDARIDALKQQNLESQQALQQAVATLKEMQHALGGLDRLGELMGGEPLPAAFLVKAGEVYHEVGDDSRAAMLFAQAAASDHGSSGAVSNLGALAFAAGNAEDAEACFYRALEREPGHREARENLRRLYAAYPELTLREQPHGVECPCCNGRFPRFIHGGVVLRPGALCPACHSLERHRLQWLYFRERTNIFRDRLKVLHFAPEARLQEVLKVAPNLDYTSADLHSTLAMEKVDITEIPYEDGTFDVILCSHVLEHIPDDRKAMAELYRVMKPGGWAILQVPLDLSLEHTREDPSVTDPAERTRLFGQHDHVRMYGRDYIDRLRAAGFEVDVDSYVRQQGEDAIRRFGLVASEDVYYCTKAAVSASGAWR